MSSILAGFFYGPEAAEALFDGITDAFEQGIADKLNRNEQTIKDLLDALSIAIQALEDAKSWGIGLVEVDGEEELTSDVLDRLRTAVEDAREEADDE